jgi:hypothetical protein
MHPSTETEENHGSWRSQKAATVLTRTRINLKVVNFCNIVSCSPYDATFRNNVLPPSSGPKISRTRYQRASRFLGRTLKMEVIRSSETSVHIPNKRTYNLEDGSFHNHLCENLKSHGNNFTGLINHLPRGQ